MTRVPDGCSVPGAIKRLIPALAAFCATCDGTCCEAHDRAYIAGGSIDLKNRADAALRECAIRSGVPVPVAQAVYEAVQFFGGNHWGEAPWHGAPFPQRSSREQAP